MVNRSVPKAAETIPAPDDGLCLAFVNTRYWRGTATPTEDLKSAEDLLRWAAAAEQLPPAMTHRFDAHRREHPDAAAQSLKDAITLREMLFGCFATVAAGIPPPDGDIAALNAALVAAPSRQRLRLGGWEVEVASSDPTAAVLLAPTLWSAADL